MSSKKQVTYDYARSFLVDKDKYINDYVANRLATTIRMFEYEGMPDTIAPTDFERNLQRSGHVGFIEHDGNVYALNGAFCGDIDAYGNPTKYRIDNVYLNINNEYTINDDCIVCKNDSMAQGFLPIMYKYASIMNDAEISFDVITTLSRITMTLTAPDEKSKLSAEEFVRRIMNGDFSVIGDSPLFDGVKSQSMMDSAQRLVQMVEALQYIKASALNDFGIIANTNTKRERVNSTESNQANAGVMAHPIDMLMTRREAIERVNIKYGTNIAVGFGSVWADYYNNGNSDSDNNVTEPEPEPDNDAPTSEEDNENDSE